MRARRVFGQKVLKKSLGREMKTRKDNCWKFKLKQIAITYFHSNFCFLLV